MDDKEVPVIFNYDYDMVVGAAVIKADGTIEFTLTDPRLKEYIEADRADLIKALSIGKQPAVLAPFTGFTTQRDIPTGDFREQTCTKCIHSRPVISDDSEPLLKCFRYPPTLYISEEGDACQGQPDANDTCGEFKEIPIREFRIEDYPHGLPDL